MRSRSAKTPVARSSARAWGCSSSNDWPMPSVMATGSMPSSKGSARRVTARGTPSMRRRRRARFAVCKTPIACLAFHPTRSNCSKPTAPERRSAMRRRFPVSHRSTKHQADADSGVQRAQSSRRSVTPRPQPERRESSRRFSLFSTKCSHQRSRLADLPLRSWPTIRRCT